MTGAFRDAPGSAAKTIKPEASHTKPGRTLLQVKTKNTKNEVEERREEENLMMMILGGTRFPNSIYTNSRSTAPWRPDVTSTSTSTSTYYYYHYHYHHHCY